MYFQNRSTSADESLPVEVKRAYYNNQLVFEEITQPDVDTRPRIEITSDNSLLTGSPYYVKINDIKIQATEVKQDSQGRNVYIYLITEQITSLKHFMDCENNLGYTISSSPNFYLVEFKYCDSMIANSLGDCTSAFANPWIYEIKGMGNWNVTMANAGNMFLRCNRLRGVLDIHNWTVNASTAGWFAITDIPNFNEVLTIYADNLSSTSWINWGYTYGKEIIMYCTQATKTEKKKKYDYSSRTSDYLIWKVVPDEDDRFDFEVEVEMLENNHYLEMLAVMALKLAGIHISFMNFYPLKGRMKTMRPINAPGVISVMDLNDIYNCTPDEF